MKRAAIVLFLIILMRSSAGGVGIEAGYFSDKDLNNSVMTLNLDQTDTNSNISLGLSLNANLSDKDYGVQSAVVRYLEYDDGTLGVRYAPLEGMTFGYGLLLNDLNTLYYQPPFLTNEQSGLRIYYDHDDFTLEGFGTYSHLYGLRIKDFSMFNMNFGIECLSDSDKASSECFGRSAVGAYMELPLTEEFSLFGECAGTSNGGEGNMTGISMDYDLIFAYIKMNVGAASFNDRFIPAYFTSGYDINPVDFTSLEAGGRRRYGTIGSLYSGILGLIAIGLTNENYNDGGSATSGSILITPIDRVNVTAFVKELSFMDYRPATGKDANMVGGTVDYTTKSGIYLSVTYNKTLDTALLRSYDASYCRIGFNY